jgi:predicted nuclease with TOPRIM domain
MDGIGILKLIEQGGAIALIAFLAFLFFRLEKAMTRLHERMDSIQSELVEKYAQKGELYSDISGWRGDLRILTDKVDKLREDFFYLKGRYDELKEE